MRPGRDKSVLMKYADGVAAEIYFALALSQLKVDICSRKTLLQRLLCRGRLMRQLRAVALCCLT